MTLKKERELYKAIDDLLDQAITDKKYAKMVLNDFQLVDHFDGQVQALLKVQRVLLRYLDEFERPSREQIETMVKELQEEANEVAPMSL